MSVSRRLAVLATSALALGGVAAIGAAPASAALPACGNTSLTVSASAEQGATGHANFILRFRNRTGNTCTIYGYPGLDALSSTDHVLAHATRTVNGFTGGSRHGIPTVVLHPGAYASADVEWMNFNPVTSGACTFSHSVATTPANTSHTVHLARSVSVCRLQVHPTVPGLTGNY
ncbi:MAG TPA: DUF4232 domain-containing protein [Jatrophihabitans sp.]|jgi:hypothetical protein|uniref:DUF4232 domain-containing protein n=1 Tax=Jatrophihabitans sp. TaxID=1932789 RepID=UPI002DFD040E|nr:DUF4232 domain-containing protein [Jatrophihabitans sp.]